MSAETLPEYRPLETCAHGWCVGTTCPKCGPIPDELPRDDEADPLPSNED